MNNLDELETALIDKLSGMPERQLIKEIEDKIFSNEECLNLISAFQKAQDDYNFTLKLFKEEHEETKQKQKILYQKKLAMDEHPLIKEYNNLLITINEPLRYLEYNLFSLFSRRGNHQC